jgi:hypothetical protein
MYYPPTLMRTIEHPDEAGSFFPTLRSARSRRAPWRRARPENGVARERAWLRYLESQGGKF